MAYESVNHLIFNCGSHCLRRFPVNDSVEFLFNQNSGKIDLISSLLSDTFHGFKLN